ncbi:permease [candidate division MSBL1 archaeon SCGC-AAA259D14]|uniref:Permease n=2 Tax=candidate division MSBL1 TaxID=215777 RepID=A0A133U698_9EURY|nr:permease [candidate division MSBL1 archaeon SCGC-AAA259D14]KXA93822.1 permease [candidate division MSBL1 archaeon SCGC-AAA259E22]
MNITAIVINVFALVSLLVAFFKSKEKAVRSLKVAGKSAFKILPMILIIVVVVGLMLGFVPPDQIAKFFGEQSGLLGVLIIGGIGAILHIPSLVAFPLAASLLESGASVMAAAAFITTLTMIGTVYLPVEIKLLGKKLALLRNGLSFIIAILISVLMGLIL